jgi:multiple sugar transport system permease protein
MGKIKKNRFETISISGAYILSVLYLLPVIKLIFTSFFKDNKFTLDGYYEFFIGDEAYTIFFWNAILYAFIITIFNILLALMTAYALTFDFPLKRIVYGVFLAIMILPYQVTLLPNYIISRTIGIYNTPAALILPAVFNPFSSVILYQFVKMIPREYYDILKLETGSLFAVFRYIIIPMIKPAITATAIIAFTEALNMLEPVLVLIEDTEKYPLGAVLSQLYSINPLTITAGCVIYIIPVFCLLKAFEINKD